MNNGFSNMNPILLLIVLPLIALATWYFLKYGLGPGGKSFRGQNLAGVDFSGQNLPNADFRGANLAGADFGGAILDGADLRHANLQGANLENTSLKGAKSDTTDKVGGLMSGVASKAITFTDLFPKIKV